MSRLACGVPGELRRPALHAAAGFPAIGLEGGMRGTLVHRRQAFCQAFRGFALSLCLVHFFNSLLLPPPPIALAVALL